MAAKRPPSAARLVALVSCLAALLAPATAARADDAGTFLTGRVTAAGDGAPVAGATVSTERTYYVVNDRGTTVETGADGRYRIGPLPDGPTVVTVYAEGHGPQLVSVDPAEEKSLDVALPAPHEVAGRVLDPDGRPVTGAHLRLVNWRAYASLPLDADTDADGRFTIADAPSDAASYQLWADGYGGAYGIELKPGGDNVVTLEPIPHVAGTVTDAITGRPIDRFRLVEGVVFDGPADRPIHFDYRNDPIDLAGGAFDRDVRTPSADGEPTYLRAEADGYAPALSDPITGRGPHALTFALAPAPATAGVVRNPDGIPAADALLYLLLPGSQIGIGDNASNHRQAPETAAGDDGRFAFRPQTGRFWLLATAERGWAFAEVSPDDFADAAEPFALDLQPWASLDATWPAAAGQEVRVSPMPVRDPKDATTPRVQWYYLVAADDAGRIAVPRLPAFDGRPVSLLLSRPTGVQGRVEAWLPVSLAAGATTTLDLTGGATVTGRVVPAREGEAVAASGQARAVLTGRPTRPAADAEPTALAAAGADAQPSYVVPIAADGSFAAGGIPPGEYDLTASIFGDEFGIGGTRLTVPAGAATVDAGPIAYRRWASGAAGQPAPPALGRRFDDAPIATADYAGKYVVAVLWDSCSGGSDADLPALDALAERFAGDRRVALVSLNLDRIACGLNGVPVRPATLDHDAWERGFISPADQAVEAALAGDAPTRVAIVAPDGTLAAVAVDPQKAAETLAGLLASGGGPKAGG